MNRMNQVNYLKIFLISLTLTACGGGDENIVDSDIDKDKVFNSVDLCPNTKSGVIVDENGCAVESDDDDNDKVVNSLDLCPNTESNAIVDTNGCLIASDDDNDNIPNNLDLCPNTKPGVIVDADGCVIISQTKTSILIQAEDYINFSDTTVGNTGGAYKTDDVDIENTTDVDGGYNIGFTATGEFLEYSINVPAGAYRLTARVSSANGGGDYSVILNNKNLGSYTVTNTGGWQSFATQFSGATQLDAGTYTLRVEIKTGDFNLNWLRVESYVDKDFDGVSDEVDQCPLTASDTKVNEVGCPDTDNDGVYDNDDNCPDTLANTNVDALGCAITVETVEVSYANDILIAGPDADKAGFTLYVFDNDLNTTGSSCNDNCAVNWPPLLVADSNASGVPFLSVITRDDGSLQVAYQGRPLYYFINDTAIGESNGSAISGWHTQENGDFGDITPLYDITTALEHPTLFAQDDAIITLYSDRGRDRHAREDQFQQYDHYLSHYWTHRTARFKFTDNVASGGSSIKVEFVTEWQLEALEFRAWYSGRNTVAEYHGNYEPQVVTEGHGTYDDQLNQISSSGDQYKYSLEITENIALDGSVQSLAVGQYMELEVSQFLLGVPEGRTNYYGTTYLYEVGVGGMVPWKADTSERENSYPIAENGWLGGRTTLPYQYTDEPDDHFMQMATNLSSLNGQKFVQGRRIHHTSFVDGKHDESEENGTFNEMAGKSGAHYVNESCASCHTRNGRATVAPEGEPLNKWVFKIADANDNPDPNKGNVLQPSNTGGVTGEGTVSIQSWTEIDGLRSPNYQFSEGTPAKFSARIAPQLVGLGLLEAIPEETILALQDVHDEFAPFGISGRAQHATDPVTQQTRLGRFGWKAATSSIKHQVAAAFNTDMGVMTSLLPNPDCGSTQATNNECGNAGSEISDEHLDDLVKYIALLGVRAQRDLDNADVVNGKALFTSVGCADCHVSNLKTSSYHPFSELREQTIHPYSDLLLHDMGAGLADNLGEGDATGAEWRTTPLWGIGLSACVTGGVTNPTGRQGDEVCTPVHSYLHDGRARSIEEAILWHGGESEVSKENYQALNNEDKNKVLTFLNSL